MKAEEARELADKVNYPSKVRVVKLLDAAIEDSAAQGRYVSVTYIEYNDISGLFAAAELLRCMGYIVQISKQPDRDNRWIVSVDWSGRNATE